MPLFVIVSLMLANVLVLGVGAGADALSNPAINRNTSEVYVVGENVLK